MTRSFRQIFLLGLALLLMSSVALAASFPVREGSRGEVVREVQQQLIDQGYLEDGADGVCGPRTVAAIKKFQRAAGLEADGICGRATYRALTGHAYTAPPEEEASAMHSAGDMPEKYRNGYVMYVSATAYSAEDVGPRARTASGTRVRRGEIAVDPSVIPLGSHVFIPGYGEAVAEDVMGLRGNVIDVAFATHVEAMIFGRQDLEIYVIAP